jgi:hypothetical protein
MKRLVVGIITAWLLAPAAAWGLVITFDGTAPTDPGYVPHGVDSAYVTGGYTFTSTGATSQFSLDPDYDASNAPPNGTDFQTYENGASSFTLSGPATFALTSFRAAAIYDDPLGTLTVTGHVNGGGTVVQVFNIPSGNPNAQWATYALPAGFVNLTSVDFDWSGSFLGIDDVVIEGAVLAGGGVPVPALSTPAVAGLGLMLALAAWFARRRSGVIRR